MSTLVPWALHYVIEKDSCTWKLNIPVLEWSIRGKNRGMILARLLCTVFPRYLSNLINSIFGLISVGFSNYTSYNIPVALLTIPVFLSIVCVRITGQLNLSILCLLFNILLYFFALLLKSIICWCLSSVYSII